LQELSNKFQLLNSEYNILEKQLDLLVQLASSDSSEMLTYLSGKANINKFVETIPSANEIFIQTIKNREST